jgi:ectoine hydroxylase-related dioxygenase (phytanoyl-CoA dioxygenase family)
MRYEIRLDKADIASFEADGVVCLRQVIDPHMIGRLAGALDELGGGIPESKAGYDLTTMRRKIFTSDADGAHDGAAQQHDIGAIATAIRASGARALLDPQSEDVGHFQLDTSTWRRNPVVRELALDSALPQIAAQLLRANKVNYCDDQIFLKAPQTVDRTAFHQDYTYFRMRGWRGCVMWICVDEADEAAGALAYVRGSHRWGKEFLPNIFMAQVGMPGGKGASLEDIENNPEKFDLIRYDTKPGDIIIHHFLTVHGAGGNHSSHPRRALSVRYAGEDMVYYSRPGAPEQPYQHHRLSEGDPLDSEEYPVVWPRPFPGFKLAGLYERHSSVPISA